MTRVWHWLGIGALIIGLGDASRSGPALARAEIAPAVPVDVALGRLVPEAKEVRCPPAPGPGDARPFTCEATLVDGTTTPIEVRVAGAGIEWRAADAAAAALVTSVVRIRQRVDAAVPVTCDRAATVFECAIGDGAATRRVLVARSVVGSLAP
jgi:hypothetical protein